MHQHLHRRPAYLDGYEEAEIARPSPEIERLYPSIRLGSAIMSAVIVFGGYWLDEHGNMAPTPWWIWVMLAVGWLLLAVFLAIVVSSVLAAGRPWYCKRCGGQLKIHEETDVSPKYGELRAVIRACGKCRKFEPFLSTPSD